MKCIYSHEGGAYCDKHDHGAVTVGCCGEENCPDRKVLTNADHIRAMTDENLANQLVSEQYDTMKLFLTLLFQNYKDIGIVDEKEEKERFCDFENEIKKIWGQMVEEKLKWLKAPWEVRQ